MGEIRFYEGEECTKHYIGKISSDINSDWNLTQNSAPIGDGEALSCALIDVKKGVRIKLYSAPVDSDASCTEILVKADVADKKVLYFTKGHTDDDLEVKVQPGKGDTGKVSRIQVTSV